jgi:hypothetical protein
MAAKVRQADPRRLKAWKRGRWSEALCRLALRLKGYRIQAAGRGIWRTRGGKALPELAFQPDESKGFAAWVRHKVVDPGRNMLYVRLNHR